MPAPLSSSFKEWAGKIGGSKKGGIFLKNPIIAAIIVTFIAAAIFVYVKGMSAGAKFLVAISLNTVYLYLFYSAVRNYSIETAERTEARSLFAGGIDLPDMEEEEPKPSSSSLKVEELHDQRNDARESRSVKSDKK